MRSAWFFAARCTSGATSRRCRASWLVGFHQSAQARKRPVPLIRDFIQVAASLREPPGLELPDTLAAGAAAAHQSGSLECVPVFGDGLTRNGGALRQPHD